MKNQVTKKSKKALSKPIEPSALSLKYKFIKDEDTGDQTFKGVELSDGTTIENEEFASKLVETLTRTGGSKNPAVADLIIPVIAHGMSSTEKESRYNKVAAILGELEPKDEKEAMLLGQYIALQESGFKCLREANEGGNALYFEKFGSVAVKFLRCANETMQTLLKYKNEGKQQVVVAHVNGGQAIIANEVSHYNGG